MSDLILYHYKLSPFSQKIRSMLGYAGMDWRSVLVRPMPPRPGLQELAGGYRKIPVAQVGADVFCDTASIARLIAGRAGKPELAIENCREAAQQFARRTDLDIFFAIVAVAGPGLLGAVRRETSWLGALQFLGDRLSLLRKSAFKPAMGKQAMRLLKEHLASMEKMLVQDFLFGDQPCAADFSAYHSLWFLIEQAGKDVLGTSPRLRSWLVRMRAFGDGHSTEIPLEDALDIARDNEAAELPPAPSDAGRKVAIGPIDYARDPVEGVLLAEERHGWIVGHDHPRVGRVHLHFPKHGYALSDRQ